ncbi:unnamed protein product, partial [Mesorhabditis spiculigera]
MKTSSALCHFIKNNLLLVSTFAAVLLGISAGLLVKEFFTPNAEAIRLISFPGEMLLQMFKMIVVPLLTVALIVGVGSMDRDEMGHIGGTAVAVFGGTTIASVLIGLLIMIAVHPGDQHSGLLADPNLNNYDGGHPIDPWDSILDLIRNAFTDNIVDSASRLQATVKNKAGRGKEMTKYWVKIEDGNRTRFEEREMLTEVPGTELKKTVVKKDGSNVLGLVTFALTLGIIMSSMGEEAEPLMKPLRVLDKAVATVVTLIVWYSPIAIVFLIAGQLIQVDDLGRTFKQMGYYLGIATMCQILVFVLQNTLFMLKAIAIAFATASSTGTIPVNMECIEKNMGVNKQISQVIIPVGATINMNGTAMHIAVSCMFIAQLNGMTLGFSQWIMIAVTSPLAALGAAGIPAVSLVTMTIVLTAIDVPLAGISVVIPIDWILDRFRTVNNTYGDAMVACLIQHYFGKKLAEGDSERQLESQSQDRDSTKSAPATPTHTTREVASPDTQSQKSQDHHGDTPPRPETPRSLHKPAKNLTEYLNNMNQE